MKTTLAGRPIWLLVLAAIGAVLLAVVAVTKWGGPSDEHAYWLAARRLIEGLPLYDPNATTTSPPFAYLYPPPLAQMLVPVAAIFPSALFSALWTVAMGIALWWLAGRDILRALALLCFLPIATEFWFRNVHLFLAVLVVLGLTRKSSLFALGAAIKIAPGLGIPFLAMQREWRAAAIATAVGVAMLVVSVALSPAEWQAYIEFIVGADPLQRSSFVDVPFPVRAVLACVVLLLSAGFRGIRAQVLLVVAVTLALPSLWFTGLSLLVAIVPLVQAESAAPCRTADVSSDPST